MSEVVPATQASTVPAQRHVRTMSPARTLQGRLRSPGDVFFALGCALAGLWALFQNFYKIGTAPILADEPVYVPNAWLYVHGQVHVPTVSGARILPVPGNFEHPPLVKYLFGIAQVLHGTRESMTAARCVSALAAVLIGLVVAVWVGRWCGRWTGLLAGALLTVIPEPAGGSMGRFDRFAMLDTVASLFMAVSVVLAWYWMRRTGRAAWVYAAATGAAVGLAAGSKENGFLGAIGPVALVLIFGLISRRRREILARAGQALAAVAAALVVFVGLYAPLGKPLTCIRYLIAYQSFQSSLGHAVGFAGQVSTKPPWWANPWFAGHDYGSVLVVFLVAAAVCGVALRRDLFVGWCAAALAAPFVFHCFVAKIALGYYWTLWTPMFLVLAAVGIAELVKRASRVRHLAVPIATGLAVLAIPAVDSVAQSVTVADIQPNGAEVLPSLMKQHHLTGPIVTTGVGTFDYGYYLPGVKLYMTATGPVGGADTIVVSQVECRDPLDASVRALVGANEPAGRVKQIYTDSSITVYAVSGPLELPTQAQIAAEPASEATDGC